MHNDKKLYTVNEAREAVGAIAAPKLPNVPFPFRFGREDTDMVDVVTGDGRGYVASSVSDQTEYSDEEPVLSAVIDSNYSELQHGSKREISQIEVMGGLSPNVAADKLQLDTSGKWEWLHLVAFSIKQTHVGELSDDSIMLIDSTEQPQQIQENLVLGTAAANTAMLTYETFIKNCMQLHPTYKLQLWVLAEHEKQEVTVGKRNPKKVVVKVATKIHYHFNFKDGNTVSPPFVLTFDARNHTPPNLSEFTKVNVFLSSLVDNNMHYLPHGLKEANTSFLTSVK